ncbi:DUF1178 family protein [Inhella sp.]|uniref:DUF1178 family protein n=1 Tax=Inhella sp. TaxID=1921806 RepID=UPI0035B45376
MWVAELACPHGHDFEGWFGSREDFEAQLGRGLVQCPTCGSAQLQRRLSAPRLNLGAVAAEPAPAQPAVAPSPESLLRELVAAVRAASEDVGAGFAAEARRIHQGRAPERAIRGQATADEFVALQDEGIAVWPLPALGSDGPAH